jgi:DNA-binding transcriptional LysR family regulator
MPSLSSTHTAICKQACDQQGFSPRIVFTVARPADAISMVQQEMGISLLFEKCVLPENPDNISIIPITPAIPVQVSLCYPKDAVLSAGARLFVEYVKRFL